MKSACKSDSKFQTHAVQYGIGYKYWPDFSGGNLTHFELDLGIFLAVRGNYSWLGYGWMGCGCGWEHNGKMPCDIYQRPAQLDLDYGTPTELCTETSTVSPGSYGCTTPLLPLSLLVSLPPPKLLSFLCVCLSPRPSLPLLLSLALLCTLVHWTIIGTTVAEVDASPLHNGCVFRCVVACYP